MKTWNLNDKEIFSLLRITCGMHLLLQQIFVQWPRFSEFYSSAGMVNPNLFRFYNSSPLFLIWESENIKWILFLAMIAMTFLFTVGIWSRWTHVPLFLLTLSFQLANPIVIHEPQQLVQLLLFILWFIPYENHYALLKSPGFGTYEQIEPRWGKIIVQILLVFLGYYYLLAGLKKLPDPLWRSGEAIAVFLGSPYLGRFSALGANFGQSILGKISTYLVLVFEISFLFLSLTAMRRWLFLAGGLFHLLIFISMDVGFFWAAMLMWYPLLLFTSANVEDATS